MRRWCHFGLWSLALGAITWLSIETRRLAELAGRHEVAARQAAAPGGVAAVAQPADAPAVTPIDAIEHGQLAVELATCRMQLQAMQALLEQRNVELERRVADSAAAASRALQPMPVGVRNCLETLHACLRAEGFTGQRFLSARSLEGEVLTDVELLDADPDGFGTTFVRAARMTAVLDRATGSFELRFFDGQRTVAGQVETLAADGWPLRFRDVDGRQIEQRLPYLVRATGVYAAPAEASRPATDVDPSTRRQWLGRLEHVLAGAGTQPMWRVSRFRGMRGGWFLQAELVGTDERYRVLAGAHCEQFAIEIDEAAGVVSLLLRSGVLRRDGVESTITAEGYRMLLPNLTPKQASDAMFGMVVTR